MCETETDLGQECVYFPEYLRNLMVWKTDIFNTSDARLYVLWEILLVSSEPTSMAVCTDTWTVASFKYNFSLLWSDSGFQEGLQSDGWNSNLETSCPYLLVSFAHE